MPTDMTIANTIWQQINTGTKMACGARTPIGDEKSLTFKVTISRGKDNRVKVEYNGGTDEYTVTLYYIRGTTVKEVEKLDGVQVGNLNDVIYRMCNK